MLSAIFLPDDALLDECIEAANQAGMYLISDGHRALISPVIPAGFRQIKITAKVRSATYATLEAVSCAA